ncbi:MAG: DUF962 domain-containing protein [Deltaproteobacteria bacterium]|nr:MAG: DUF962 domain-containing protein [Deltaproteobacteria bacterium]
MDKDLHARIEGLGDFWSRQFAYYLNEHRDPRNRATHMVGIPILVVTTLAALVMWDLRMFVGGQLLGWAIQILGHKIEGNKPALLKNPVAFLMGPTMVFVEMLELAGLEFGFAERARKVVFEGAVPRGRGAPA